MTAVVGRHSGESRNPVRNERMFAKNVDIHPSIVPQEVDTGSVRGVRVPLAEREA